jgi:hypothetical protein
MKQLKKIGKFPLVLLIIFTLFSFGFKAKEYFAGKKYIEYL